MATLKFNTTVESKARNHETVPVVEGQFLILTDTGRLTYDFGGQRIVLGDIVELENEEARKKLLAPLNKFYYVKSTNTLWRYNGSEWVQFADSKMVEDHIKKSITSTDGVHGLRYDRTSGLFEIYNEETSEFDPVSFKVSKAVTCVLKANGWSGNTQSVQIEGLKAKQDGVISMSQDSSAQERESARAAALYVSGQRDGELDISMDGDKPAVDIAVTVILLG